MVLPPRSKSGGRFLELSFRISPPPRVTTPWVEWGGDVQLSEAPSSSSLTVSQDLMRSNFFWLSLIHI